MPCITRRHLVAHLLAATGFVVAASAPARVWAAAPVSTINPGQLTVAYRTDDRPISFIENGVPAGYLVEFVNAIGAKLDLKVVFISTSFAAMLPAVKNDRYDSAAFGVLVTPERQAMVDFTKPIGYGQAKLVSRKAAPIAKVDGAVGKTIAVTQGSALIPLLNRIAPGVEIREFPNVASSLNALLASQVDGLFTGLATAEQLVEKHGGLASSQTVTSGVNAFPVAKTNKTLLAALNGAIEALMDDGTYTKLFHKWNPPGISIPDELYTDYPHMPHAPASR